MARDNWSFDTARGRATVGNGELAVAGSVTGLVRSVYRRKWWAAPAKTQLLLLISVFGVANMLATLVPAASRFLAGNRVDDPVLTGIVAVALCVAVAVRTRKFVGGTAIDLDAIDRVTRDADELRIRHGDGEETTTTTVVARTAADAADAVEILRLKGVAVDAATEPDGETETETEADQKTGPEIVTVEVGSE